MRSSSQQQEIYLVLGGAGFLGSYIVQALLLRGETSVAVFDLSEPIERGKDSLATYYVGDICDRPAVLDVLKTVSSLTLFPVLECGALMISIPDKRHSYFPSDRADTWRARLYTVQS